MLVITPNVLGTEMSRAGGPKLGWLSSVERLDPELERSAAPPIVEALREHEVDVLVARRPRDADRAVAERAERHRCEGVDVEPVGRSTGRTAPDRRRSSGRSAPRSPCSERARPSMTVIGRPVRAWKMPPSFQPPRSAFVHARPVGAALAALAERQLVGGREDEVVADVVERRAPLGLGVVGVLPVGALGGARHALRTGAAEHAVEAAVVGACPWRACRRPGTRGRSTLRWRTLACSELYWLPPRDVGRGDGGDERLRAEERPARVLRRPGRRVADARQRLVALDRRDQVGRRGGRRSRPAPTSTRSRGTRRTRSTAA